MSLNNYNDNNDDDRPKTPLDEDCCGSECTPCIFDVHKTLLKEWESRKTQNNVKVKTSNNLLSPLSYKVFIITDISETSEDYFLVYLKYSECETKNGINLYIEPGQHVILHSWCKSRPYTPISWTCNSLTFLVKLYKQGEFSSRLKNASIGSAIDIRGPYGDFKYKSNRSLCSVSDRE